MKSVVVIPARYNSTRFPGKSLALLKGKPLIIHCAERAAEIRSVTSVIIATDDVRIKDVVQAAGFNSVMTGEHNSGSDRVGEAVKNIDADIIVNLQGDEPLLNSNDIDRLIAQLADDADADLGTLAHPFIDKQQWMMPNVVKLLVDNKSRAIYFSRAPLPGRFPGNETNPYKAALRHIGVYVWRKQALQKFLSLPPSKLEQIEGLEQLRAIEAGMSIMVLPDATPSIGVDTPEDLMQVEQFMTDAL